MKKTRIENVYDILSQYEGKAFYSIPRLSAKKKSKEQRANGMIMADTQIKLNEEKRVYKDIERAANNISSQLCYRLERANVEKNEQGFSFRVVKTNEHILDLLDLCVEIVVYDLTQEQKDKFVPTYHYNKDTKTLRVNVDVENGGLGVGSYQKMIYFLHDVYENNINAPKELSLPMQEDITTTIDKMLVSDDNLARKIGMILHFSGLSSLTLYLLTKAQLDFDLDKAWEESYRETTIYKWMLLLLDDIDSDGQLPNRDKITAILNEFNLSQITYDDIVGLYDDIYSNLIIIGGWAIADVDYYHGLKSENIII